MISWLVQRLVGVNFVFLFNNWFLSKYINIGNFFFFRGGGMENLLFSDSLELFLLKQLIFFGKYNKFFGGKNQLFQVFRLRNWLIFDKDENFLVGLKIGFFRRFGIFFFLWQNWLSLGKYMTLFLWVERNFFQSCMNIFFFWKTFFVCVDIDSFYLGRKSFSSACMTTFFPIKKSFFLDKYKKKISFLRRLQKFILV